MKKMIKLNLLFVTIFLTIFATIVQAQSTPAAQPPYKDVVVDNPNAETDMKVVSDFINALTNDNRKGVPVAGNTALFQWRFPYR